MWFFEWELWPVHGSLVSGVSRPGLHCRPPLLSPLEFEKVAQPESGPTIIHLTGLPGFPRGALVRTAWPISGCWTNSSMRRQTGAALIQNSTTPNRDQSGKRTQRGGGGTTDNSPIGPWNPMHLRGEWNLRCSDHRENTPRGQECTRGSKNVNYFWPTVAFWGQS